MTFLGNTAASVATTPMSASTVAATVTENIITATVSGITAPNGITSIQIPTWSDVGGQDDIKWYTATKQSDGSYQAMIDAKNHKGDSGTYSLHAYGVEADGRSVFLGNTSVSVRYVETPIMGATTVSAAQLVAYYKSTGSVYPQHYNDLGVNLEKFVALYIQECNAEGVRAEVAFRPGDARNW
jgi:GBS Bsp-like repeat.